MNAAGLAGSDRSCVKIQCSDDPVALRTTTSAYPPQNAINKQTASGALYFHNFTLGNAGLGHKDAIALDLVVRDRSDSGADIAKAMAIDRQTFVHPTSLEKQILSMECEGELREIAWEFLGTTGFGDDIMFAAFESAVPESIMLPALRRRIARYSRCAQEKIASRSPMPLNMPDLYLLYMSTLSGQTARCSHRMRPEMRF